ncbi:MAG TPA: heat-shock protein, partial [Dyella sp.]
MSSPLAWFGLADDADEREIKRAYARRLKTTRPDEDPAGFQQLHDMYQRALAWQQQQPSVAQLAAA